MAEMTLQPSPNPGAASATPEAVPRIVPAGDCALVVTFGEQIDREVSRRVVRLGERVMTEGGAGVIEAVPGMASLTVHFDPEACDEIALASRLRTLASDMKQAVAQRTGRRWTIPACYDGDLALDQAEVSARCDLAPEEIVRLHSGRDFHVYMLGFLPGFPYMGDLDAALRLPRRSNPRIEVPAGSIAIAGAMTAIYPAASPGGWHLIGRTPVPLFAPECDPPSVLAPGDAVRFEPVRRDVFERISEDVRAGAWRLDPARDAE